MYGAEDLSHPERQSRQRLSKVSGCLGYGRGKSVVIKPGVVGEKSAPLLDLAHKKCFIIPKRVQFDDHIEEGDMLGTVCAALGREVHQMRSERTGSVLTLRTYPRVLSGDMVAVILGS